MTEKTLMNKTYPLSLDFHHIDEEFLETSIAKYEKQDTCSDKENKLLSNGNVLVVPTGDSSPPKEDSSLSEGTTEATTGRTKKKTDKKGQKRNKQEIEIVFESNLPKSIKTFKKRSKHVYDELSKISLSVLKSHLPLSLKNKASLHFLNYQPNFWNRLGPPTSSGKRLREESGKRLREEFNLWDDGPRLVGHLKEQSEQALLTISAFVQRLGTEEMAFYNAYGHKTPKAWSISNNLGDKIGRMLNLLMRREERLIHRSDSYCVNFLKGVSKDKDESYESIHAGLHMQRISYILKPFVDQLNYRKDTDTYEKRINRMQYQMPDEIFFKEKWRSILEALLKKDTSLWRPSNKSVLSKPLYILDNLTHNERKKMLQEKTKSKFKRLKDNAVVVEQRRLRGHDLLEEITKPFKSKKGHIYNILFDEKKALREKAAFCRTLNKWSKNKQSVFAEDETKEDETKEDETKEDETKNINI
eukprot:GHVL01026543.1.p1 GENE.GHVL01026543.1~~GHVL01026543.1.p1  ORF type:complete len:472 (-),score=85.85 GHVL01026543.1:294-1709(-)